MNKYIVISPYSRQLRNGQNNPKNYPYWQRLINMCKKLGYDVYQIGTKCESPFDDTYFILNSSFADLEKLVKSKSCAAWIAVDNFFPHFCASINVPGFVLWGQSDPKLFGYDMHVNIYKSKSYFRKDQFYIWEGVKCIDDAFVEPEEVLSTMRLK